MTMKKTLLLLAMLGMFVGTQATTYYVAPDGSGSSYTLDGPGKFTSTVIGKLQAGDVLMLRGGQYDLKSNLSISRNGTAEKMILIQAYPGEKPILDFREQAIGDGNNGLTIKGNYLHIKGLTVRYAGYKGIWLEKAKYCILEQLDVYGCCNAGIQLRSGGNNMVINCDSHENFDYQDDGGNADGFADKQGDACPGNIYIGCRAWGNSDDGWDSYQRVTSGTPTVYINCVAYNNGPATFNLSNHPRVQGKDADLSCFSGKDLANFANGGNPNGFKVGGKGTQHNVELYRCLAVGHRSKGFDQNSNAGLMKIINCTAYKNKYNYGFGNSYNYTLYVYNNIALSHTSGGKDWERYSGATVYQQHNTWNGDTKPWAATEADFEGLDVTEIIFAERNADGTLPETSQFHLKATATHLIDQGLEFTDFSGNEIGSYVSYNGTAPDLGCYEYEGAAGIGMLTIDEGMPNLTLPRYNLNGQRVDNNYKGIVIQGGKKYIVK